MPNSTNDIRALQQLPMVGGLEEDDEFEARWCTTRSCGLNGPTC